MRHLFFLLGIGLVFFTACGDDEPIVTNPGQFANGVFIINQGSFGSGTGSITHYNRATGAVTQDIFQAVNGFPIGNVAQSLAFVGDRGYIMVNNAGKAEVVDAGTFESLGRIEGLAQPRYMVAHEGRGYISQWGADGFTGQVQIVDLQSLALVDSFTNVPGAEQMLVLGDRLLVCASGGFGRDSQVHVFNLTSGLLEQKITVGDLPNSLQRDANGDVWVLCGGYTDWANPANNTNGRLVRLDGNSLAVELLVGMSGTNLNSLQADNTGQNLYCLAGTGGGILRHSTSDSVADEGTFADGNFYGLGVDPQTNIIYAADAKDFVSEGEVRVFNDLGIELGSIPAGIIPGGFAFR